MNWNGSSLQGVSQINGNLLYYEDVTTSTLLGWQTSAQGAQEVCMTSIWPTALVD